MDWARRWFTADGRLRAAVPTAAVIVLSVVNRALAARWPSSYGQLQPLGVLAVVACPMVIAYLALHD